VLAAGLGRAAGGASVVAGAGGAISGIARDGLATSGGVRRTRRSLSLGRPSRLKIEIIEYLRDYSGH
jgi:hypothetical protein